MKMPEALTAFIADRTPRERVLLLGMATVALIAGMIVGVWQPLRAGNVELAASVQRNERALRDVAALPTRTGIEADNRPAPVIITEAASEFGLAIRRLQPVSGAVQVVLDEAAFDAVLLWLETLERDHGLRLADLSLTRRPAPGAVAATLTLEAANAD